MPRKIYVPSLPIQLCLIFAFSLSVGSILPTRAIQIFYALSLSIQSILIFILPAVIFACLYSSVLEFSRNRGAFLHILAILFYICASNFTSTWIAYLARLASVEIHFIRPEKVILNTLTLKPA